MSLPQRDRLIEFTYVDICRSSNSKAVTLLKIKNVICFIVKKRTLHRKLYTQEFLNSRCKKIKLLLLKALYFWNFLLIRFEMTLLIVNYQENIYYIYNDNYIHFTSVCKQTTNDNKIKMIIISINSEWMISR